jgi:hypothetical protein
VALLPMVASVVVVVVAVVVVLGRVCWWVEMGLGLFLRWWGRSCAFLLTSEKEIQFILIVC